MKSITILLSLTYLFSNTVFSQSDSLYTDTLVIHIIYGSKPKSKDETSWFGGKLGGHIGLQIEQNRVIHFNPHGHVNGLNAFSDTGVYVISSIRNFYLTFPGTPNKTAQIYIPVTRSEKDSILTKAKRYYEHPPYPYALFGMRCAAACYDLLSAGIFPGFSQRKMTWKFITPRKFRKYIYHNAADHHWNITCTEGRTTRKWDHD